MADEGSAEPAVPSVMFQSHQVPVLILGWGWFDHGYGPGPLGVDAAVLADLGHVVEPRVVPRNKLFTLAESISYYTNLAIDADRRVIEETQRAARFRREARRLREYGSRNQITIEETS